MCSSDLNLFPSHDKGGLVSTIRGRVPIESLAEGDEVLMRGQRVFVKKMIGTGKKLCYELVTKSGYSVKASYDHPFRIVRDGKEMWMPLTKLKKSDKILMSSEESFGPQVISEAYLIGAVLAAGWVADGRVGVNLGKYDVGVEHPVEKEFIKLFNDVAICNGCGVVS